MPKGKPDGYELLFVSPSLTISPGIYKKLNYDPVKDLAAISLVMEGHYVLLVRPSLPVKSLKEFIEYAKANPGKINFGGGIGTPPHLSGELLNTLAKIKMVLVPYKGVNQAMIGMMSNEIDMVIIGTPAALPQIQAGKVRPLAVLTKERVPSLPDVPTAAEAGVANYVVKSWYGIMAPAGTPRDIIARLNAEWAKIAADARHQGKDAEGSDSRPSPPRPSSLPSTSRRRSNSGGKSPGTPKSSPNSLARGCIDRVSDASLKR